MFQLALHHALLVILTCCLLALLPLGYYSMLDLLTIPVGFYGLYDILAFCILLPYLPYLFKPICTVALLNNDIS